MNLKRAFLPIFGPKSIQNRQKFLARAFGARGRYFQLFGGDAREKKAFSCACDWRSFTNTVQYTLRVQADKALMVKLYEALRILHSIG